MSDDKIAANNFYQDDGDKIKQNWFLYEYANVMYMMIEQSHELKNYKDTHKEDNISAFCIYFTKRLRQSIANRNNKIGVAIDARYIYEFYPQNTRAQTQRLLNAAGRAWEEHLESCSVCSNCCLSDGFSLTPMFDNMEKTGWPTVYSN
jgi:hypothetical protein